MPRAGIWWPKRRSPRRNPPWPPPREQVNVNTADTQKVKTLMDYTRVTAPFAGVITKRYADTGSMIQAGTASQTQAMPVVRLSENSLLRLILPVPESAVPTVHIGQQVEVRVPTLNRSFPGVVARFTGQAVSRPRAPWIPRWTCRTPAWC